jgi:hemerythrin-like domain-containing protein
MGIASRLYVGTSIMPAMSQGSTTMADSRDMVGVHNAFRNEYAALPDLIRGVAANDARRAAVVADHIAFVGMFLEAHHTSEDDLLWPKLHERAPHEVRPLVHTMAEQHHRIHATLEELAAGARRWGATGDPAGRDALARTAAELLPLLNEHLALEEAHVLSLIDRYLTDREWKEVAAASGRKVPGRQRSIALGMLLHHNDAAMEAMFKDAAPTLLWLAVRPMSARAWRRYSTRLNPA